MPEEQRARAARALDGCPRLVVEAGGAAVAGAFPDSSLLVVESGTFAIVRDGNGARPVVVAVAGRDAVVPAPAANEKLVALTRLTVTAIPPNVCPRLLAEPDVAAAIVRGLSESVRGDRDTLAVFGHVSHEARVRAKLLQLARAHGKVVPDGILLELSATQELVAAMVGSARETVSTALAELTREGFLSRDGRFFKLAVRPEEL